MPHLRYVPNLNGAGLAVGHVSDVTPGASPERSGPMPEEPSYTQLVIQILRSATRPLTVNETLARMAAIRPVETRNPAATVRNAMSSEHRIVTLGGRPAHYIPGGLVTWPAAASASPWAPPTWGRGPWC